MNLFISVANLCRGAEEIVFNKGKENERVCAKLRLADNTFGKNETRFFDAIVSGPDVDTANRLEQGDQIVIYGTLNLGSYKAKKGKMKGKTVRTEDMPFAKIMQVTKSKKFFESSDDEESGDAGDTSEPDLEDGEESGDSDAGDAGPAENPLADLENA